MWIAFLGLLIIFEGIADIIAKEYQIHAGWIRFAGAILAYIVANVFWLISLRAGAGLTKGEKPGLVADPDWKAKYFENDPISSKWYLGDTYHIAIGQGDMLATPLQVAVWTSAIANNGTVNKPHIIKEVISQSGDVVYKPKLEELINVAVSEQNIKFVQEGMRENVIGANGSGRQLATLPVSSAGKTGTSQFDGADPSRTHAWFTSYAPYENPEIVIVILVEAGGEGHAAAV